MARPGSSNTNTPISPDTDRKRENTVKGDEVERKGQTHRAVIWCAAVFSWSPEITIISVWSHTACSYQWIQVRATFSEKQSMLCYNPRETDTDTLAFQTCCSNGISQPAYFTPFHTQYLHFQRGHAIWPIGRDTARVSLTLCFRFQQINQIAHKVTCCWSLKLPGESPHQQIWDLTPQWLFWRIKKKKILPY